MYNLSNVLRVITLIVSTTLLLAGCDSDSGGGDGDAPPVFSSDAFILDTEMFEGVGGKDGQTGLHFINAAFRVGSVSAVLAVHTIIPSAITTAALQATPSFDSGVWTWTRTVSENGQSFEFVLTATPASSHTDWAMNVTIDGPYLQESYTDFQLFTGQTENDGAAGSWELFYKISGERTKVLTGSYNQADEDTRQVTFRIPLTAENGAGDTVLYQADGIQRSFYWTQVQAGLFHDIRWNSHTSEGSIRAGSYLGGALSCWDGYFDDAGCPTS